MPFTEEFRNSVGVVVLSEDTATVNGVEVPMPVGKYGRVFMSSPDRADMVGKGVILLPSAKTKSAKFDTIDYLQVDFDDEPNELAVLVVA